MQIINEQTELVDVRNLKPHPKNANVGNADLIAESISTNGFYGQIIAQRSTGHILVGHHRLQAAQQLGAKEVPVTWVDVDDTRALKIMLADNQTAALAHRDEEALASLLSELKLTDDLTGTGYGDADLDSLIASIAANEPTPEPVEAPEPQVDRAEELRAKWGTERGQLWLIPSKTVPGKSHRLLCGDSTVAENQKIVTGGAKVDLLHADPPYGINLLSKRGSLGKSGHYDPVLNDDKPFDPAPFMGLAEHSIFWGANHFAQMLPPSACWLVWDKQGGAKNTTFADCELAWCSTPQPARCLTHIWDGFRRDSEKGVKRDHPNQKPIEVIRWAMAWVSPKTVFEPFMGSGTTMVACEQAGILCYGMELEPKYIAVILERLSGMGLTPELQ